MKKKATLLLGHVMLSTMIVAGMRGAGKAAFGDDSLMRKEVRMMDRKSGPKKKSKRGNCLCSDPMPLTSKELEVLADFPAGKAKKKFVKQLKIKYGKV